METKTKQIKLIPDEDLPGCFVVMAADGFMLGHGDTKAEALSMAREQVLARVECRKFNRFMVGVEKEIERLQDNTL